MRMADILEVAGLKLIDFAVRNGADMVLHLERPRTRAGVLLERSYDDLFDASLSAGEFMHAVGQFDAYPVNAEEAGKAAFRARLMTDVENAETYISSFQEQAQRARERTNEAKEFVDTEAGKRIRLFKALRDAGWVGAAAGLVGAAAGFGVFFTWKSLTLSVVVGVVAGGVAYGVVHTMEEQAELFTRLATTTDKLSRDAASLFAYAREWKSQLAKLKISLSRDATNFESVREELEKLRNEVNSADNEVKKIQRDLRQYLHPERNDI